MEARKRVATRSLQLIEGISYSIANSVSSLEGLRSWINVQEIKRIQGMKSDFSRPCQSMHECDTCISVGYEVSEGSCLD